MRWRFYIRASLTSVFYASLVFLPMHEPGMLFAAVLQAVACACTFAFLIFLVAYRDEICELIRAAFQEYANLLVALLVAAEPTWSESDLAYPTAPSITPLSQRPPPLFA